MSDIKKQLNQVSPSFCLAKWYQVTTHLQLGLTHSCHNPPPHRIPVNEVQKNPGAIHNTSLKLEVRGQMLRGERPEECEFCWRLEDQDPSALSDRMIKSADLLSEGVSLDLTELKKTNPYPFFLELGFSNACNFKCSYCSPAFSSLWMEEIKKQGPYPREVGANKDLFTLARLGQLPIPEEENPYIQAFWSWWPEAKKHLKLLRITGGEPFLSPHTRRLIESLIQAPEPNLKLAINSNLGLGANLLENYFLLLTEGLAKKAFKSLDFYVSLDSVGECAEYIRYGMDFKLFDQNIRGVLKKFPDSQVVIMSTFCAFSYEKMEEFLAYILDLKKDFLDSKGRSRVVLDFAPLDAPIHMSYLSMGPEGVVQIQETLGRMKKMKSAEIGYTEYEVMKLERILKMAVGRWEPNLKLRQQALLGLVSEFDRRRGTDFKKTFPRLFGHLSG